MVGTAVCGVMVGHTVNQIWSGLDFWLWLGSTREFAARPLHPLHPILAVESGDPYLSFYLLGPYSFMVELVDRITEINPVNVLAVAGIGNLVLVIAGIWRLTKRVSQEEWAPLIALVFTLAVWGWHPWRWSGYLALRVLWGCDLV